MYIAETRVTVTDPDIVDVGAFDMTVGDIVQLITTPTEDEPIMHVICDNLSVLAVTDAGELTALAEGVATVTVIYSKENSDGTVPVRGERYTVNVFSSGGSGGSGGGSGGGSEGGSGGGTTPKPPTPPAPPATVTSVVFTTQPPSSITQGNSATVKAEARGPRRPRRIGAMGLVDRAGSAPRASSTTPDRCRGPRAGGACIHLAAARPPGDFFVAQVL